MSTIIKLAVVSIFVWSVIVAHPSQAEETKTLFSLTPSDMKWSQSPSPRPSSGQIVMLHGDVEKPGLDIYLIKYPPNVRNPPHRHPNEIYVIILSGTLYRGVGETFDESKLKALPAGSFYVTPANAPAYFLTKEDGVVFEVVSMGEHPFAYLPSSHD